MPLGFGCEAQYPVAAYQIPATVNPTVTSSVSFGSRSLVKAIDVLCTGAVTLVKSTARATAVACASLVSVYLGRFQAVAVTCTTSVAAISNRVAKFISLTCSSAVTKFGTVNKSISAASANMPGTFQPVLTIASVPSALDCTGGTVTSSGGIRIEGHVHTTVVFAKDDGSIHAKKETASCLPSNLSSPIALSASEIQARE